MRDILLLVSILSLVTIGCDPNPKTSSKNEDKPKMNIINPIPIDVKTLSGLDLKPVTNKDDPDRRLFQKQLYRGPDLSVYVVSSETATARPESYGIDEFLYVLNGRARINPVNGEEVFYNTGDFFMVPKGFNGEWETQGGDEFLIELSVITTKRAKEPLDSDKRLPYLVNKAKLSGIGITAVDEYIYKDELYEGAELSIAIHAQKPDQNNVILKPNKEQFVYVISGAVDILADGGEEVTFYRGDFFLLPKGIKGTSKTMGHGLFRYLSVTKAENMGK